jgi:dCTP deaminase
LADRILDPPELFPDAHAREPAAARSTGILPSQHLEAAIRRRQILAERPIEPIQVQPASLDLRLGPVGWQVAASFLPGQTGRVDRRIEELRVARLDLEDGAVLRRGKVYIIPLLERLRLPAQVWGKANAKSTTGRLDAFARLITDYNDEFDRVPAGYDGPLYLEVFPRTFDLLVQAGTRLNQVRFGIGAPVPSDAGLTRLHERETLVYLDDDEPGRAVISRGLWISIDTRGSGGSEIVGYRARRDAPLVDLARVGYYDPGHYWQAITRPERGYIVLEPEDFYILASRERVRVPLDEAAEMVSYEPLIGEFRVHYAGFFDPGFGYGSGDLRGTRAVLEVRAHGVPFVLEDGQRIGRLLYEPLLAPPDKIYGVDIGSSYQGQDLALSKQFKRGS